MTYFMHKRSLLFFVFIFCFLVVACVFAIGIATKSSGFSLIQTIFTPMESALTKVVHTSASSSQLDTLKQKNIQLEKELVHMHLVESDNKALRDQFETTTPSPTSLLPISIVGMPEFLPGVTIPDSVIIAAGFSENIKKGQAVVYKDQLLGTVFSVSDHVSKVQLMTDSAVSFAAKTAKTGALGIIKGLGNGQIEFDNVVLSDKLEVGDMVVSGADEDAAEKGIPPGLIIGKITSIEKKSSSLFQKAHIEVLTDVTRLPMVFIVKQ
jgi:rod shape-determining protein MreC